MQVWGNHQPVASLQHCLHSSQHTSWSQHSICTLPMSRNDTTFCSSIDTSADFCDVTSLNCTLILCDNDMPSLSSRGPSSDGQLVTSRTTRPGAALTVSLPLPTPHTRDLSWDIGLVRVGIVIMSTMVPLLFLHGRHHFRQSTFFRAL